MFGHPTKAIAGYECIINGNGTRIEHDLKSCVHCSAKWRKRPGSGIQRGFCTRCMGDCCTPECGSKCYPFEQRVLDEGKLLNTNPLAVPSDNKLMEIYHKLRG